MTGCRILTSSCSDHPRGLCPCGPFFLATENDLGYTIWIGSSCSCTYHRVENETCFWCPYLYPCLYLFREISIETWNVVDLLQLDWLRNRT